MSGRRRAQQSVVANPVLVGAVTTLVVIVAVFLAYNANSGLPFVPTKLYKVQISSGSNLVPGNDVREGGYRVGVVEDMRPVTLPDGNTVAELSLKLDQTVGDLPMDTQVKVRPRSALGLKYVEIERGNSERVLANGGTIPVSQTNVPVQLDDLFKIFDDKTRAAAVRNLDEFGNGFTGRGVDVNVTVSELPELFRYLTPVARNLADDRTQIGRFFRELGDAARVVAPLADTNARLFSDLATTFEAISRDAGALRATIEKSPSTLDVATVSLREQRPFLSDTADFSEDLRTASRELRGALPDLNPALRIGTPVLNRTVAMNQDLKDVTTAARALFRSPMTLPALRALTATVTSLNPTLRYVGPYVTVCNYWNYFWATVAEHVSESSPTGTAQRALFNSTGIQTNSVGTTGAFEPANGSGYQAITSFRGDPMVIHGQPYSAAINDDGSADCEAGQRGYPQGPLAVYATANGAKDFSGKPFQGVVDPHTPGSQGTTFRGRPRVIPGQTFSREPGGLGVRLPRELTTGVYAGTP